MAREYLRMGLLLIVGKWAGYSGLGKPALLKKRQP
jgi:hypothetical protein